LDTDPNNRYLLACVQPLLSTQRARERLWGLFYTSNFGRVECNSNSR
jgi:hypothetical protein